MKQSRHSLSIFRIFRFSSLLAAVLFSTWSAAAKDTISDCFLKLPAGSFLEIPASELLRKVTKNKQGILDTKNGYLLVEGDGAQVSLQAALFRLPDGHPLLAVAYGELELPDFTHIGFFIEQDGKMLPSRRIEFPFPADGGNLRFELPRIGRTIIVKNLRGKTVAKVTWNGYTFVKEK